jgi:hypothetical protein
MTVADYLSRQDPSRRKLLSEIHEIIITEDPKTVAEVGKMMSKEMILYKTGGIFKYGLASNKEYMSLHAMPIYGAPRIHEKYRKLLPQCNFQKGCINFKQIDDLDIMRQLIADCAAVDLLALMAEMRKSRPGSAR